MKYIMRKIIRSIVDPFYTFKRIYLKFYIFPKYEKLNRDTHKKFLGTIGYYDEDEYEKITNEVINDKKFTLHLNNKFEQANLISYQQNRYAWPVTLYYIVRKLKPAHVVETGVFLGVSSSYILKAIRANNFGKLYSIDLPAYFEGGGYYESNPYLKEKDRRISLPPGKEPGFIIPDYLRKHWDLRLGATRDLLPNLLKQLGNIDLFLHDSLHSYENMMFEFKVAYRYLNKGGYIFADNIDWNVAFYVFCKEFNISPITYIAYCQSPKLYHNFGAIRK